MRRGIQNPAKHLTWSRKERLAENNYGLELFQKDITMFHRDLNTVEVLNIPGF